MGSAPSQYFQGDGAKPRAQSHNLSYNSTGWVASAVSGKYTLSFCLPSNQPPPPFSFHVTSLLPLIRLCSYLLKLTVLLFILTIFFSSLFFRHLRAGSPSKFQPGTHMHHLTFPLTHLISLFMVGHSPSVFCAALVWGFSLVAFTHQML